jgi:hypothetical protein
MSSENENDNEEYIYETQENFNLEYKFVKIDPETGASVYRNTKTNDEVEIVRRDFIGFKDKLYIPVKEGRNVKSFRKSLDKGEEYVKKFIQETGLSPEQFWLHMKEGPDGIWTGPEHFNKLSLNTPRTEVVNQRPLEQIIEHQNQRIPMEPQQIHHQPHMGSQQIHHRPHMGSQQIHHQPHMGSQQIHHQPPMGSQQIHHQPHMGSQQIYHQPHMGSQQIHRQPHMGSQQIHHQPHIGPQQIYHQPHMGSQQIHRQPHMGPQQIHHQPHMGSQQIHRQPHMGSQQIQGRHQPRMGQRQMQGRHQPHMGQHQMQGRHQPHMGQHQMQGPRIPDFGTHPDSNYHVLDDVIPNYATPYGSRVPSRAQTPEPMMQPLDRLPSVGGDAKKIKDKAKKYFYKLLNNPNTIYLTYKKHLYIKFNNYLLSVKKLQEYIYSKDSKQVKKKKNIV